jgi:hypothetical protein
MGVGRGVGKDKEMAGNIGRGEDDDWKSIV